jgi:hypothetical protein
MARRARSVIVAIAIGAGCTMPAQLEAADQEHSDIRLLIVNEAGVDSSILTVAKAEATRIYDAFGIRLVWTEADQEGSAFTYVVKIIPRALKGRAIDVGAMGIAPGTRESRGTVAYAFYDRIQDVTLTRGADVALILGHVIAHEIGHLLLPYDAHAKNGLMRAGWNTDQTMRAMRGALTFTAQEAALIQQRLRNIDSPETAPG